MTDAIGTMRVAYDELKRGRALVFYEHDSVSRRKTLRVAGVSGELSKEVCHHCVGGLISQ